MTNGIAVFKGSESCVGRRGHLGKGELRFAGVGRSQGGQKPGSLGTEL